MSNVRVFKKSEILFKEGDKAQVMYLVQAGSVSVGLHRGKKAIELYTVGTSQMVGEYALLGQTTHQLYAQATTEVKAIEIPLDSFKQQIEHEPQLVKLLIKSLCERLKHASMEVKSIKLERDSTPCPEEQLAKIFGALWHTANHKGEKKPDRVTVKWSALKMYAQRVFMESPKRLEQVCCLLTKLKLAQMEFGKSEENPDPEAPEELLWVHFFDLQAVDNLVEFYQYYYFKGGKMDLLKPEDQYITMIGALVKCAEGVQPDRHGGVTLDFPKLIERMKSEFGINFNNDHLARLEAKGLFARRVANDKTVNFQFDPREFQKTHLNWKILREVEKWNEKGFIDMNEEENKKKASSGPSCPSCSASITAGQKFCGECGHKLQAA